MYLGLLLLHSYLRWVVLVVGGVTLVRTSAARNAKLAWASQDDQFSLALATLADVQLLVGLLLLALSPSTRVAVSDGPFSSATLTFFSLVHPVAMLAATAWLHVGRVRLKRSPVDPERHARWRRTTLSFLALLVLAIPWPTLIWGRPLFRVP
jgi:hypothetical protein